MGYVQKKLPWNPPIFSKKKSSCKNKKWKQQKILDSFKELKQKPEKKKLVIIGFDTSNVGDVMNFIFQDDDM